MNDMIFDLQRFATGSSYSETLTVSYDGEYVYAYGGNDSIYNYWNDSVRVYAGDGNDTIYNRVGYYHTIDGGADNDRIINHQGWYSSINGGYGTDVISLSGNQGYVTVKGGYSDDIIYGDSNNSYGVQYQFYSGDGYDTVYNWNSNDTLNLGGAYYTRSTVNGNVVIGLTNGYSGAVTLSGASGKTINIINGTVSPVITNNNKYSLVSGGAGNDTISNSAGGVTIRGNGGHDTIYNSTTNTINNSYGYVTIDGGDGNDSITSYDPYVSINGGAGADRIYTGNWKNVTIRGGTGNDTIYANNNSYGILYQYAAGDGYDSIIGYGSYDSISITGGSWSTTRSGSDVIVNVADSNVITLVGAYDKTINIYPTNRVINNYNKNSIVSGGSGNDTISNSAGGVTIRGNGGHDTIYNSTTNTINNSYGYVTIDGGDGNDSITSYDPYVSINGGAGADRIYTGNWKNVTIRGGTGNDTIYANNNSYGILYQYAAGDGYDSIIGYGSYDSISITGGSWSTTRSGSDVIVNVADSNVITLVGAYDKTINIYPTNRVINNYNKNSIVSGTSYAETVNNYAGGAKIQGYGGDDSIYNSTSSNYTINNSYGYVTIDGGDGNDSITSYDPYVSINGGAGADRIYTGNWKNVTIRGGTGNDTIYANNNSYGILYQYAAGDGYDSIIGYGSYDSISITGGSWSTTRSGSDVIVNVNGYSVITLDGAYGKTININPGGGGPIINYNDNTLVSGTSGNDTIYNYGDRDTVNAGGGNDTIYNDKGDYTVINAGDGRDSIRGNNDYATVNAGYGNDTITGNHWRSRLNGDGDNDLISITTYWYNTLDGGAGDDTIIAGGNEHSVNGGAGSDRISLSGDNVTVRGGYGNDSIVGSTSNKHLYQYFYGDGYDTIYNWSSTDTLKIIGGKYKRSTVSNDIVITSVNDSGVTNGAITLVGAKGKSVYIDGDPYRDDRLITNINNNTSVNGTAYNDSVLNGGWWDNSYHNGGYNVTVNAGAGDDSIYSSNSDVSLSGGTGKDTISVASGSDYNRITIKGGGGNDVIYGNSLGGGILYQYGKGDGNDIIYGHKSSDSISVTGGATWTTVTSGNNVLVNITDSGTITLSGAYGKTINVYPKASTVTQQDVIKKFMASLDTTKQSGVAALNEAVRAATNGYFQNIQAAVNQMISDCQRVNNATTFLRDYCGIVLGNNDTGAITGSDAGGVTKTKYSVVPDSGSPHNFTGSSFKTSYGLTVKLANIGDSVREISYSSLNNNTIKCYIWQAMETWWANGALKLITDSYGSNYGFTSNAMSNVLYFGFFNKPAKNGGITLAETAPWVYTSTGKQAYLAMQVNMEAYGSMLNNGNPDGESSLVRGYLDRTIAHEMTHAVMMANVNNFGDLPQFITEGVAELTHGSDDDRRESIEDLAKASNISFLRNSLAFEPGTGQIALGDDKTDAYAGGFMFMRYLAKQGAEHYSSASSSAYSLASRSVSSRSVDSSVSVSSNKTQLTLSKDFGDNTIDLTESGYSSVKSVNATALTDGIMVFGNTKANSIIMGSGKDSVFANTGNDTINGGAGSDVLCGEAGNDSINGGTGADTISGGTGTDTLIGGKGKDLFIHKADKDIIVDYTPGEDKIKLAEEYAKITSSSLSGNDVVLTVNDRGSAGTIVVKGTKGKKITVIDYDGNETSKVYGTGGSTLMTVTNSTPSPVTVGSAVKTIDASSRTTAVKIAGNALNNSIKGGSGNDSISGLAGDDKITAGNGKDTITGGDGKDLLYGQANDDKVYGQGGNDSLYGGAGNDSLWGGVGNDWLKGGLGNDYIKGGDGDDTFVYNNGDGKDKIVGFDSGDLLQITGDFTTSYNSSKREIYFKVGSTDKAISITDFGSTTTFHVNNYTYQLSGDQFKKR